MTDQQHPITIPPDLEEELLGLWPQDALQRAAQWGADQELDACCEWGADQYWGFDLELRAARRPKPKSLAEEALEELSGIRTAFKAAWGGDLVDDHIRRALERLQELEGQQ